MSDPYGQLKQATPEQLVDAYIWEIDNQTDMSDEKKRLMKRYLRLGFQLAQEDGWERVAPHWLRMSLKECCQHNYQSTGCGIHCLRCGMELVAPNA